MEWRHVTSGGVMGFPYSRLAISYWSLATTLLYIYTYYHSHPCFQPCANNYRPYAYEAERWCTCLYTIIVHSV